VKSWNEKPKVLIVDDDADFVSDMKIMLSSEFEINSALNTREAQEILKRYRPDCMLLDLNMPIYFGDDPECEGLSFLQHIKNDPVLSASRQIPVIVLSVLSEPNAIRRAKEQGVTKLYGKPPNIKELKASIWDIMVTS
jgi:CheY-like chemotaxis protein